MTAKPTMLQALLTPGALQPRYQPIFDVSGGRAVLRGAECLTRGPQGTNLESPDLLFAYARHKRAESEVDRAAITAALAGAGDLASMVELHVNVHASTLSRDRDIVGFLLATCHGEGISPERLTVEVVEQSDFTDRQAFLSTVASLRTSGFTIALDDVGLGRSNFLMFYLTRPQVLKADRFFVHGVAGDPVRRAVLVAVQQLGLELGAHVVAEGVEEEADLEVLREVGIREAQGFLFSRPVPADELRARVAEEATRPTAA